MWRLMGILVCSTVVGCTLGIGGMYLLLSLADVENVL